MYTSVCHAVVWNTVYNMFVNVRTYRSIMFCLNVQCVYVMYLYDCIMTLYIIIISYYECKYYYHLV